MPTFETDGDNAKYMAFLRGQFEDPATYNTPLAKRIDGKYTLLSLYDEVSERIERDYIAEVVRVKNTSGGVWSFPYLLYLDDLKLTPQTTDTATNSPAAGAGILYNVTATYELGQVVSVASAGYTEYAIVTAVDAGVSVTLDEIDFAHATPVITALPAYEATAAQATSNTMAEWVTRGDISDGGYGWAFAVRNITGINTAALTLEKLVYLSDSVAGGYTETAPVGTDQFSQVVGVVKTVDAANGEIHFFPGKKRILKFGASFLQAGVGGAFDSSLPIRNETGGPLVRGTLVRVTGYSSAEDKFTISTADNGALTSLAEYVLSQDIADNTNGTAAPSIEITGTVAEPINTGAVSEGTSVFLGNNGGFVFVTPTRSGMEQKVGIVRVVSATVGAIWFFPGGHGGAGVNTVRTENDFSQRIPVRNSSGGPLVKGTLVYLSGWDAAENRHTIAKADASSDTTLAEYVLFDDIADTTNGWAHTAVEGTQLDTSGATTEGDDVFLSDSTPGAFVYSAPIAPSLSQTLGTVSDKNAGFGRIVWAIGGRKGGSSAHARVASAGALTEDDILQTQEFL